jgi:oligopeptidase A
VRTRFNAIQQELAELSTTFSNHLLDATKAFYLDLHQPEEIEGLPPSLLQMAAQAAREAGHDQATLEQGPWRITLDFPSVGPFLEHSRQRDLREQVYRALITRASEGELDNTPLIRRILELRCEQASILGYANYAELSLASKMAPDVSTVETLLEQLRQASFDAGHRDLAELRDFARSQGAAEADELQHWDIAFWSERLREHRYAISDEELRPYFPLPQVLDGLFALVHRLFGVTIRPADGAVPVWHPDVRFFRIYNGNDEEIAAFYLDAYSRPAEKRGGAWMDGCVGRSRLLAPPGTSMRLPVAYLVCNQTPASRRS